MEQYAFQRPELLQGRWIVAIADGVARSVFRSIMYANFSLFVIVIIPITNRLLGKAILALRPMGLEDLAGSVMRSWVVGSTLLASFLFAFLAWRRRRLSAAGVTFAVRSEGIMLSSWWAIFFGSILYFGALGAGG